MTFSSMPVPRRAVLACAIRMLEECRYDLRVVHIGPQGGGPPELEARATDLGRRGRLLEVARADFGLLFPLADCFVVRVGRARACAGGPRCGGRSEGSKVLQ